MPKHFASRPNQLPLGKIIIVAHAQTSSDISFRSTVSGITYSGNTATGCKKFGVIIDQSYPSTLGTPGTGVKLSVSYGCLTLTEANLTGGLQGVTFSGTNTIAVGSSAKRVAVNCGSGSCTGKIDCSYSH